MEDILKHKLIGIGEFSHGINESWLFRLKLLKYAMKKTKKKIIVFNEMSAWQAQNIMNGTVWSRTLNRFIELKGFKKEIPIEGGLNRNQWGCYWQYMGHSVESKVFLRIIRFIRKNRKRITLIGVDNDTLDRDYPMYQTIMKHLDKSKINFFWAHNHHVADMPLSQDSLKYMKNKKHKWYCGYYLKQKLKDDYCIILTQSYQGINRFNSVCSGNNCSNRTWKLKYMYRSFRYPELKKYLGRTRLLTEFDKPFISFSNSLYQGKKHGVQSYDRIDSWNYVLFWNKVTPLEAVCHY